MSSSESKGQDLSLASGLDAQQLDNIKAHLDLILLALEALAKIGSESILQAAQALGLETVVADQVRLWRALPRPCQTNPLRKRLDMEEAGSLVLIICYLAKKYQELIRRAVTLLEQVSDQEKEAHKTALLGDYLDTFSTLYENRIEQIERLDNQELSQLALKLLVALLFYSTENGHRRLWLALLDHSHPML